MQIDTLSQINEVINSLVKKGNLKQANNLNKLFIRMAQEASNSVTNNSPSGTTADASGNPTGEGGGLPPTTPPEQKGGPNQAKPVNNNMMDIIKQFIALKKFANSGLTSCVPLVSKVTFCNPLNINISISSGHTLCQPNKGSPPVILNVCKSLYKSGHHFQNASIYGLYSLCGIGNLFSVFNHSLELKLSVVGYPPYFSISSTHLELYAGPQ